MCNNQRCAGLPGSSPCKFSNRVKNACQCLAYCDDGYAFGVCFMSTQFYILTFIHFHLMVQTLYPAENLDEINKAFQHGLELVKEAVLLELEATNASRTVFDGVAVWSPPLCPVDLDLLRCALVYGAWTTAYGQYHDWRSQLDNKPYNTTPARPRSHKRASRIVSLPIIKFYEAI